MKFTCALLFVLVFWTSLYAQDIRGVDSLIQDAERAEGQGEIGEAAHLFGTAALLELDQKNNARLDILTYSLMKASLYFYDIQDFEKSINNAQAFINIAAEYYGKENENYILMSGFLTRIYFELEEYDLAITILNEIKPLAYDHFGENHEQYYILLDRLSDSYLGTQQLEKAENSYKEFVQILKANSDTQNIELVLPLINLGVVYTDLLKYDLAHSTFLEAILLARSDLPDQFENYNYAVKSLMLSCQRAEKFNEGIEYLLQVGEFLKTNYPSEKVAYAKVIYGLGIMHTNLEQFSKALEYYKEVEDVFVKEKVVDTKDYGEFLCDMAELYHSMGELDIAVNYALRGIGIIGNIVGKNDIDYAIRLYNLSIIYSKLGQLNKAIEGYKILLPVAEEYYGIQHPEYNLMLLGFGLSYQKLGQFDKAYILFAHAVNEIERSIGKNNRYYWNASNNLALLAWDIGRYEESETLFIEALEIADLIFEKSNSLRVKTLNNLTMVYVEKEDFKKAFQMQNEVLSLSLSTIGKNNSDYALYLNNLALIHIKLDEYEKALPLQIEAISILKEYARDQDNLLIRYLSNLSFIYRGLGDSEKSLSTNLEILENLKKSISKAFYLLSEQEKEKFIHSFGNNFNLIRGDFWDFKENEEVDFGPVYDIELISKELILSSSRETRETILNGDHFGAKDLYKTWLSGKKQLAWQYSLTQEEQSEDLYTMEVTSEKIEQYLIRIADSIKPAAPTGLTTWKNIQSKLKENEVAIEFSNFPYYDGKKWTGAVQYVALLLRKNDKTPLFIPLCQQAELDNLTSVEGSSQGFVNDLYRGLSHVNTRDQENKIYDLVWKPLEPYLEKDQTIYFSPSGSLHQIAFSAIVTPEGNYLSDNFQLKQLSTTSKLGQAYEKKTFNDIVLFGGIDYDAAVESPWETLISNNFVSGAFQTERSNRGESWNYLQGTSTEVSNIEIIAKQSNIKATVFKGKEAQEENFKNLGAGNSPSIVHVATHGFFFPEIVKKYDDVLQIKESQSNSFKHSDNSMNRSGLLFAGANKTWKGQIQQPNTEDGILTAYEASFLSLANTELVVLSACETGLGDVKGSEGVFGLQRAFKAAGVSYLLVSLWKVPDTETAEFMEYFYTSLFSAGNIEESFSSTQKYMKEKYSDDPYKWAAFVLIR